MRAWPLVVALTLFAAPALSAPRVLRVCADPNNLPFSSRQEPGLENQLAQLLAAALGAELAYTWWPQRRGFLRHTLGARRCDVVMGVPTALDRVLTTRPYYQSSYVFVTRRARGAATRRSRPSLKRRSTRGLPRCARCSPSTASRWSSKVPKMLDEAAPLITCVALALLAVGCEREMRRFDELAALSRPAEPQALHTELHAGERDPSPSRRAVPALHLYDDNAYAIGMGKRYFVWFNCSGCHAQGGGGMGPPLMDAKWRYGSEPEHVFESIVGGRPNGMPAFRGKIPAQQVWQLVAYVRTLGGLTRLDVAPGRSDNLNGRPPEVMLRHRRPTPPQPESVPEP